MNKERNKQFFYREINRILIDKYCKRKNKVELNRDIGMLSIIMLSFNRVADTIFSIKSIYKYVKVPFELIVFDNNSDIEQLNILKKFLKSYDSVNLIESSENLGCAGGRVEAGKLARGEYFLFLDNDIVVTPYCIENLINTINLDEKTVAVCSKVVFPDMTIQFNGGTMKEDENFYRFNLLDSYKYLWERDTIDNFMVCPWIPGGATLWKAKYFKKFPIDSGMQGSFEDNEVSIRIRKAGYKLRNCPKSIMIHYHINFKDLSYKEREKRYMSGRYNNERTKKALRHFWRKHKKAFIFDNEEATYGFLGDYENKDIFNFLSEKE